MPDIILASKSKVRKEILDNHNINNRVEVSNVDVDPIKEGLLKEGASPEIISKKSEFGDNFVPIAIFDCDFDDLVKNSKKHDGEITILCDDDRIYFDKFEVQNSFLRFLVGITIRVDRFFKALLKGYNPASNMSGAFLGLPADILVDENGIVQKALYGSHTANHIPLNEVVQFSKS